MYKVKKGNNNMTVEEMIKSGVSFDDVVATIEEMYEKEHSDKVVGIAREALVEALCDYGMALKVFEEADRAKVFDMATETFVEMESQLKSLDTILSGLEKRVPKTTEKDPDEILRKFFEGLK